MPRMNEPIRPILTGHNALVVGVTNDLSIAYGCAQGLSDRQLLAKSLSFLAGADAAGIVLGTRVPIILTSRADSLLTRLASCAVAVLVAAARRQQEIALAQSAV
jgi:hypothetical protein